MSSFDDITLEDIEEFVHKDFNERQKQVLSVLGTSFSEKCVEMYMAGIFFAQSKFPYMSVTSSA